MATVKPLFSPEVKLDRQKEKIMDICGSRWAFDDHKYMDIDGLEEGKFSFVLLHRGVLREQFKFKLHLRAFALKMDVPGKHVLCGPADRRFTSIVEKKCFFEKEFELDENVDKDFELDLASNNYEKLKMNPNFDYKHDIEIFVKISVQPMETTWSYFMKDFEDRADLESPTEPHDRVLKVGDKKFYVQTQLLVALSGYFQTMFTRNYLERSQHEVEIKEVDPEIFHDMLKMMYQVRNVLGDLNVVEIYKMADFFQVRCVFEACSEYMSDLRKGVLSHIIHYIKLADDHKDGKMLMAHFRTMKCLMGSAGARGFVTAFQSKIRELSQETQTNLLYWLATPDPYENMHGQEE